MRTLHDPILRQVYDSIRRLLPGGGRVLVAVSGGRDSMVLADAVCRLARPLKLRVTVAHVHHGLRGADADADEALVLRSARLWKCAAVTTRVRTQAYRRRHRLSLEEAARHVRYRALDRLRRRHRADLILTAHHADDQAETVLLRALRGSHRRGLSGILPVLKVPPVARPLLAVKRSEIDRYVASRRIVFREDASNADLSIRRNLVRRRLLALVGRALRTDPLDTLPRLAEAARRLGEATGQILRQLETGALRSSGRGHHLMIAGTAPWPAEVQNELLVRFLRLGSLEPTNARLAALRSLLRLPVGRWRPMGGKRWRVYRERDGLALVRDLVPPRGSVRLRPGSTRQIPGGQLRVSRLQPVPRQLLGQPDHAWVDRQAVKAGLTVRLWRPADRIIPLGMSSSRKVSDLLTDRKVPAYRKRFVPVVVTGRRIVWVCGVGLDERSKVGPETTQVLQFSYHPNV